MIRMMSMESLEWEKEDCDELPEHALPQMRADRNDADIDAYLRKMYALQQYRCIVCA